MLKLLLILLTGLVLISPALADPLFSQERVEAIYFNLGTHTDFYNAIQNDMEGGMRKFEVAPTLGAGITMSFPDPMWKLIPEFNWVLPRKSGNWQIIKNLLMFRLDLGFDPFDWLRLRLGTSLMLLNQHGRGGKVMINNGNEESPFYYPEGNRSSWNNTFDLGIETFWEEWSLRLQTYTYSMFREEQRQLSYSLFISYQWEL